MTNTFDKLIVSCKSIANNHGWNVTWDEAPTYLMLIVTEVAEAMDAYRDDDKVHLTEELVDAVIRILHLVGDLELPFSSTFDQKMEKNRGRPYRHGRKRI